MHKVVHVRKTKKFDAYIGRSYAEFKASRYGNPFHIGPDGNREEVLMKYASWFYAPQQEKLRWWVRTYLMGKILGCWCKPFSCHGDIIAGYLDWKVSLEGASTENRTPTE